MISQIAKLILGLCLLMLVVLLAEWFVLGSPDAQPNKQLEGDTGESPVFIDLPELAETKQTIESYSEMVDRPLFVQGRRPVIKDKGDSTDELLGSNKIDDLRLYGIYSIAGEEYVLLNRVGKNRKYLKKSAGDNVSGWELKDIQADRVVFEKTGREHTLMLRKPKPKVAKKVKTNRKRTNRNKRPVPPKMKPKKAES